MTDHILSSLKAYCALVGSMLTALIATGTDLPSWVPVVTAVVTAVGTYAVPNKPRRSVGPKE